MARVLASTGTNDFSEPTRGERVLNMAQAELEGWALPEIIAAINTEAIVELERKRSELQLAQDAMTGGPRGGI